MGQLVRMSPVVRPVQPAAGGPWTVPPGLTFNQFEQLKALSMDAVEQDQVDLIKDLGDSWIAGTVPNQPVRMAMDTLRSEPGDPRYADAKARWLALSPLTAD